MATTTPTNIDVLMRDVLITFLALMEELPPLPEDVTPLAEAAALESVIGDWQAYVSVAFSASWRAQWRVAGSKPSLRADCARLRVIMHAYEKRIVVAFRRKCVVCARRFALLKCSETCQKARLYCTQLCATADRTPHVPKDCQIATFEK